MGQIYNYIKVLKYTKNENCKIKWKWGVIAYRRRVVTCVLICLKKKSSRLLGSTDSAIWATNRRKGTMTRCQGTTTRCQCSVLGFFAVLGVISSYMVGSNHSQWLVASIYTSIIMWFGICLTHPSLYRVHVKENFHPF